MKNSIHHLQMAIRINSMLEQLKDMVEVMPENGIIKNYKYCLKNRILQAEEFNDLIASELESSLEKEKTAMR